MLRVYSTAKKQTPAGHVTCHSLLDVLGLAEGRKLGAEEIHLWLIPITEERVRSASNWISFDEHARAATFKVQTAKHQFVVARGYLRRLLAHYLDVSVAELVFQPGPNGKPFLVLPEGAAIGFNVSHTEHTVALGFSMDADVGVDIERIRRDFAWRDVAALVLSEKECSDLAAADDAMATDGFFDRWVAREAALKLKGQGIIQAIEDKRQKVSKGRADAVPFFQVGFRHDPDLIGSLAAEPFRVARESSQL